MELKAVSLGNMFPLLTREETKALGTPMIKENDPLVSDAYAIHHPQEITGLNSQSYLTNSVTRFPLL